MGALCSCFRIADVEEREESRTSNHRNCMFPNCLMQSLKYKCGALFGGVDIHSVPSIEYVASSSSMMSPTTHFDADSNVTTNKKSANSKSQKSLAFEGTNLSHSDPIMQRKFNLQISSELVIEDDSKGRLLEEDEVEDVCPTCLEEYTLENPKIVIQCRHSYHLGCIYEWMERSEMCPICGKLVVFDEMIRSNDCTERVNL